MTTFNQFVSAHEGVVTDVDGAYGGQCWDLWSSYAQECCGVSQAATSTTSGYADSVYTAKYEASSELQARFDKIGTDAAARAGDVAFWAYGSSSYPQSHVAIVIQDNGENLLCLSQNPGPAHRVSLTKSGLVGYLRPKTGKDNTVSAQDLYDTKGSDGRNLFDGIIQTRSELRDRAFEAAADAIIKTKGNDGRNILDGVIQARYDIADLKTTIVAQTAAIEALSKAIGADPDQIAQAVETAVKEKLDQLDITVSVADGQA